MIPWQELSLWDIVFGFLGGWLMLQIFSKKIQGPRLPPGPPGKPFVGNWLDLPKEEQWKTYALWAKEYGNLFCLKIFTQHIIVVNSLDVAHDLFEKKSSLYSDRVDFPMLNDLMGFDWNVGMMHYGERWRRHRKMFYRNMHPVAVKKYFDIQLKYVRAFLPELRTSQDQICDRLRHFTGAFIMDIAYGIKVQHNNDPYLKMAEKAVEGLTAAATPGSFLVDQIPIMKYIPEWVPGATFRKKARIWRESVVGLCVLPFETAKASLLAGTATNSIAATLLEELSCRTDAPADEEEVIRNITAIIYLGGADTIPTVLLWFIVAMILHPEVQRKAQTELDSMTEPETLPNFEDLDRLPYINAICKESLRWNPIAPFAIGHRVTEDNVYHGFLIPKGTIALGNAWAMLHDENVYGPNPDSFEPERFLRPGVPDPFWAFGFGRRMCPGRHLSKNFIYIIIASILKVYDILPAKDDHGNEITIDLTPTFGTVAAPSPFKCEIKPRLTHAMNILAQLGKT